MEKKRTNEFIDSNLSPTKKQCSDDEDFCKVPVTKYNDNKTLPQVQLRAISKKEFRYVTKSRSMPRKYMALVYCDGKSYSSEYFLTSREAADAADKIIVTNNLGKQLNFPENYPELNIHGKSNLKTINIDDGSVETTLTLQNILKNGIHDIDKTKDVIIQFGTKFPRYTIIEKNDLDLIKNYTLSLSSKTYISVLVDRKIWQLHRFLLKDILKDGDIVDHIHSNPLDNRRRFLRVTDHSGNGSNKHKIEGCTSNYIGVFRRKDNGRLRVVVVNQGKKVFTCYKVKDEVDCARLRDLFVETKYPGVYKLNFKDWQEPGVIEFWTEKLKQFITW